MSDETLTYHTDGTASCTCGWSRPKMATRINHECVPYLQAKVTALEAENDELKQTITKLKSTKVDAGYDGKDILARFRKILPRQMDALDKVSRDE